MAGRGSGCSFLRSIGLCLFGIKITFSSSNPLILVCCSLMNCASAFYKLSASFLAVYSCSWSLAWSVARSKWSFWKFGSKQHRYSSILCVRTLAPCDYSLILISPIVCWTLARPRSASAFKAMKNFSFSSAKSTFYFDIDCYCYVTYIIVKKIFSVYGMLQILNI